MTDRKRLAGQPNTCIRGRYEQQIYISSVQCQIGKFQIMLDLRIRYTKFRRCLGHLKSEIESIASIEEFQLWPDHNEQ